MDLETLLEDFADKVKEDFDALAEKVLDKSEELDAVLGETPDPKTIELIADFLERVRPHVANHFIQELDGLLSDLGR